MSKDKIENCTLNRNWIWNGKEYLDIITWNAAIEAAAKVSEEYRDDVAPYEIRKLKK